MIKQLKWKMVMVVMVIVTIIVGFVCAIFYHTTTQGIRRASVEMLMHAAEGGPMRVAGRGKAPEWEQRPDNNALAYFLIQVDNTGEVLNTEGDAFHFEVEPSALVRAALAGAEDIGELKEYKLRFVRRRIPDGWRIAFNSIGFEQQFSLSVLVTSLLIGCGALFLFFLLSLGLAHWATRPIEQAWTRQKQFIADASHEIKTPLTVILSNADMLCNHYGDQDAQLGRWLDNIRAEGALIRRLVESMLFLARSDACMSAQEPAQRVDWSDAVESSVLTFEPLIFEHGLSIESEIQPGYIVQGSPDRLRWLADILLDNAVKYTLPGGQIHVTLTAEQGKHALLTVSNPSPEITDDQAGKLFDRFFRLDPARTGQKGYGLGLSIAQSIVVSCKGKIWMTYRLGTAFFYVRLPLIR